MNEIASLLLTESLHFFRLLQLIVQMIVSPLGEGVSLLESKPTPVQIIKPAIEVQTTDKQLPLEPAFGLLTQYTPEGFEISSADQRFSLSVQNRLQFRFASPFDSDPRSLADLQRQQSTFMIRRARTKLKGHAYWDWLKYAMQYDWRDPILRDLNLTIDKYPWAKLWLGRGKVLFNDERVTSSGKQQFVNRSIVNDIFTVDRQEGIQLSGHLFPGTWHDLNYAVGVFTGLGVGERQNDDHELMYSGRLQWNVMGGALAFSQSDLEFHPAPTLNLAIAAATNNSRCTAFATSAESCQQVPGFQAGESGQYRVHQMMEEIRFKWQGFSINHELHWKQIRDQLQPNNNPSALTDMLGGFLQLGYFPHMVWPLLPTQLELAARYGFVDPNLSQNSDLQQEFSGVLNYFFNGHNNKISMQLSHLMIQDPEISRQQAAWRFWLQWDFSF